MSTRLRRYKYLTIGSTKHRSRRDALFFIFFKLIVVFVVGLFVGSRFCDFLLNNCKHYSITTAQQNDNSRLLSHITSGQPPFNPIPPINTTKKRSPPVLKKLPEKFLQNFLQKKPSSAFPIHMGIIFLVGQTDNNDQQILLQEESKLFGDILQCDVQDNYFNLPKKVLAGFQWLTYDLGNVSEFYVTTDDDCIINMPTSFDYLYTHKAALKNKLLCGFIYNKGSAPMRKKHFKWSVSREVYPADAYPVFCHGGMTIWPFNIINAIYRTSEITNYTGMHLEDVLITGILRMKTYNSSNNIVPRGFQRRKGKYRRPEYFVNHLGLSRDLKKSFIMRWHESKAGLRMGPKDVMINKQLSAYHYNASQSKFPIMQGFNVTGTVWYFTSRWSKLKPQRKRIFLIPEKEPQSFHLKDIDENHQNNPG